MKKYLTIILAIAAIGIALVIIGCRTHQTATTAPATTIATPAATAKITVGPDEAACPVMGTVMKKADMIPVQHNGNTYYMCCRDCLAKFKADPEKYIKNPAPLTRSMPQ